MFIFQLALCCSGLTWKSLTLNKKRTIEMWMNRHVFEHILIKSESNAENRFRHVMWRYWSKAQVGLRWIKRNLITFCMPQNDWTAIHDIKIIRRVNRKKCSKTKHVFNSLWIERCCFYFSWNDQVDVTNRTMQTKSLVCHKFMETKQKKSRRTETKYKK